MADFILALPKPAALEEMGMENLTMKAWLREDSPIENLHLNSTEHLAWQKAGNSKQRMTLCL